jgi:hypothetical protein
MKAHQSKSLSDFNLHLTLGAHAGLFVGLALATPLVEPSVDLALKVYAAFLIAGLVVWPVVGLAGLCSWTAALAAQPASTQATDSLLEELQTLSDEATQITEAPEVAPETRRVQPSIRKAATTEELVGAN